MKKQKTLVYGNFYHVYTRETYLGIAECKLINGETKFLQSFPDADGDEEQIECSFISEYHLATDEEVKKFKDLIWN